MKSRLLLSVLAIVLITTGCANFTASRNYDPSKRPQDGLVLVSFLQSFGTVKWMYREKSDTKGVRGLNERFISTTDSINDLIYRDLRIIYPFRLKPGRYEFFRWTLPEVGYYSASTNDFSIEFEVLPGVVTYIGSIFMVVKDSNYRIGVLDESRDDIPAFLAHYKNVSADQVAVRVGEFKGFDR